VIVLTAMMATVLFGVMGLAIEVSGFYSLKRKMQTAADAGAKSGAIEIYKASGHWDAESRRGATQNGYTGGVDGVTVTVNHPPSARADARFRTNEYVEVIVQQTENLHLMTILTNKRTTTVTAWAVGGVVTVPGGANILVLDPSAQDAFKVSGGGLVNIEGGIQVNSSAGRAMNISGGSTVTATSIGVTGGYVTGGGGWTDPTPQTGVPPLPDPLASLPPPVYTPGCDYTNVVLHGGTAGTPLQAYPGRYCGGLLIKAGSYVNFNPGQYIMIGRMGLTGTGGSTFTGTGVTFYNTWCKNAGDACYSVNEARTAGPFLMGGGGAQTLSAPTSGPMTNILFFQDRDADPDIKNDFSGGSTTCLTGTIYLPTQFLRFGGGGGACGGWQMIIVDLLEFSGGSTIVQGDPSGVAATTLKPCLVE
jgi:Flp pilus assembly protein TadG